MVNTRGAIIKLYSEEMRRANIVAIVDARILEKVLPIKIVLRIKSGFFKSLIRRIAAEFFLLALCWSLYLLIEVILVSAAEKNAEVKIKKSSNNKRLDVDMFSMFYPKYIQKLHVATDSRIEITIKKLFSASEILITLFLRMSAANNNHMIKVNVILVVAMLFG